MKPATEQPTLDLEHQPGAVARAQNGEVNLLQIIDKLTQTPNLTIEQITIVERLVQLRNEERAQERRENFFDALARVQKKSPRITQNGVMVRGEKGGKILYATREDIDAVMRPIYQAEGFSVTWNAPVWPDGKIRVVGSFTCHGHTEEREWSCLPDPSGGKTGPQAVSSTLAYGKRQVSKEFWDVIEEGKDLNGQSRKEDVTAITQEQADEIRSLLDELPNPTAYKSKVLKLYNISKLEDLRLSQLADIHARIKSVRMSQ